jgi:hypothetical protein
MRAKNPYCAQTVSGTIGRNLLLLHRSQQINPRDARMMAVVQSYLPVLCQIVPVISYGNNLPGIVNVNRCPAAKPSLPGEFVRFPPPAATLNAECPYTLSMPRRPKKHKRRPKKVKKSTAQLQAEALRPKSQ